MFGSCGNPWLIESRTRICVRHKLHTIHAGGGWEIENLFGLSGVMNVRT